MEISASDVASAASYLLVGIIVGIAAFGFFKFDKSEGD